MLLFVVTLRFKGAVATPTPDSAEALRERCLIECGDEIPNCVRKSVVPRRSGKASTYLSCGFSIVEQTAG
jgi:hypothetical protein